MDSKQFTLCNREYRLFSNGTLQVWTQSKNDWCDVLPKKILVGWKVYYRYALYNPGYDWTDDNKKMMASYEQKLAQFNQREILVNHEWPAGTIVTRNLSDLIAPKVPKLGRKGEWKRFYVSHWSLVCQYWHWYSMDDDKFVRFTDIVTDNMFDVANWWLWELSKTLVAWGRKKLPVGVVNTILANAGRYSTDYIGEALWISWLLVTRVILGKSWYDKVGDRSQYAMNIRASRWAFYGIVCYDFESVYDFINRVLVHWSNDRRYDEYANYGERKRHTKGRMGYWIWVEKYGRDERVSKELMKRWVQMNAELIWDINDVEELCKYVDNWVLGSDRCWSIEKYNKYMMTNKARMPEKVKVMKGVPCTLRTVWVQSSNKTLYDLTDWELINLFDYCAGNFQGVSAAETVRFVEEELEAEPNWLEYEENWYESADEFWASYVSLLGWQSVWDFRTAYGDMLRSIPYTS